MTEAELAESESIPAGRCVWCAWWSRLPKTVRGFLAGEPIYAAAENSNGKCHARLPTASGFPTTNETDFCPDWKSQ